MCSSCALSLVCVLCFLLERGVRILALLSCSGSVLVFVSGIGHSRSRLVLLWERAVSSSLGPCAPLSVCVVFCTARGSGSAVCFFVVLFCCTQLVFSLAACFHVCHLLCEHMACLVWFYVPCALMSIVLTPPILLPVYWLIYPTCFSSLPSSFAPFIISLCLQSRASSLSNVVGDPRVQPCQSRASLFSPTG